MPLALESEQILKQTEASYVTAGSLAFSLPASHLPLHLNRHSLLLELYCEYLVMALVVMVMMI